jgi:hypothetical protein
VKGASANAARADQEEGGVGVAPVGTARRGAFRAGKVAGVIAGAAAVAMVALGVAYAVARRRLARGGGSRGGVQVERVVGPVPCLQRVWFLSSFGWAQIVGPVGTPASVNLQCLGIFMMLFWERREVGSMRALPIVCNCSAALAFLTRNNVVNASDFWFCFLHAVVLSSFFL